MDDATPTPETPRRRFPTLGLAAAGTLAGVVLGLSGMASAADEPATPTAPTDGYSSTVDPADCPKEKGATRAPAPGTAGPETSGS